MKQAADYHFSLCMPIQLVLGSQSPERHCCSTSVIIIAAIISKAIIALIGLILHFGLGGIRWEVKNWCLSMESTSLEENMCQNHYHHTFSAFLI